MASNDQPFDEREQRLFLAEILKASSISPLDILHFIQEKGISPNWVDILIPNGRSVSACMKAYESLLDPASAAIASFQPRSATEQPTPVAKAKNKRPPPDEGLLAPGDQVIQAHPFATVNTSGDHAYQFAPPLRPTMGEPSLKKRGRPTKEEHERRVREAAERGEVYPKYRKPKTPRQSLEGVADLEKAALARPGTMESGTLGDGSASKKKAKKAKSASTTSPLAPDIPARISSLEATARAADRMQIDTDRGAGSTILEIQPSGIPVRESLLAGAREPTAREAAATVQPYSPLKEELAPSSELRMYSATPNYNDRVDTTQKEEEPAT